MYFLNVAVIIIGNVFATGYPIISIPDVANCGDDTQIMCETATTNDDWGLLQNGKILISKTATTNDTAKKYSIITTRDDVTITIHNTNVFTDAGKYRCFSGFSVSSPLTLALECKARNIQVTTDETKRLQITSDQLFPNNAIFSTMIDSQPYVHIEGSSKCEPSRAYNGYYKCKWRSSFPLDDGTYSYNVTVKTITESEIFSGIIGTDSPCLPSNITVKNIQITSAILYWTLCSHGFFIQFSRDNVSWINLMLDNGRNSSFTLRSYELHSLDASSVYFVRFAALNVTEIISFSDTVEFRTLSEKLSNAEYINVQIAGLVGGNIIILMMISCVVFRCKYKQSETESNIRDMSDNTNYSNQHVAGPSNEYELIERNTGDMICVNKAFDNQVSGSTVSDGDAEDIDDVVVDEDEDRS